MKYILLGASFLTVLVGGFYFSSGYFSDSEVEYDSEISVVENTKTIEIHNESIGERPIERLVKIIRVDKVANAALEAEVEFPSGQLVSVIYKNFKIEPLPIEQTDQLSTMYTALEQFAENGDGDAAHFLSSRLKECSYAPRTDVEKERRLSLLRNSQIALVPRGDGSSENTGLVEKSVSSEGYGYYEEAINLGYKYCRKISDQQISKVEHFSAIALNSGSRAALAHKAFNAVGSYEGYSTYKQLWDKGYVDSGHAVAIHYQKGVYDSAGQQLPPNYAEAYSYIAAMNTVWKKALLISNPVDLGNKLSDLDRSLQVAASYLTLEELAEADRRAVELIEKNTNCCFSNWVNANQ